MDHRPLPPNHHAQAARTFLKTRPLPADLRRAFPVGMPITIDDRPYLFPAIGCMPLVGVWIQTQGQGQWFGTTAYVIAYPNDAVHTTLSADVLLWLPAVNQYGYYLYHARKLKVFAHKTWTDIEANPTPYLTHQFPAVNLEALVPIARHFYPLDKNLPLLAEQLRKASPGPRIIQTLEDHVAIYERALLCLPYHRLCHEPYHALIDVYQYLATRGPHERRMLYLAKATTLTLRWQQYTEWLKERPTPFEMYVDDEVVPFVHESLLFNHPQWSYKLKGFVSWLMLWMIFYLLLVGVHWVVVHVRFF